MSVEHESGAYRKAREGAKDMERTELKPSGPLLGFFIAAFGWSWVFWLAPVLSSLGLVSLPASSGLFVGIGAHGPLVAALVMRYREGGWAAVKQLLRSGFNLRMAWKWWGAIIIIPLLVNGLAVWANTLFHGYQLDRSLLNNPTGIILTFLIMFLLGGAFQEEFGWRGYALPTLLQKWNPLAASLVLGAVWGLWHLPLFYVPGTGQANMPFIIFAVDTMGLSVLYTWLFLQTRRNLFSALLLHAAFNTSMSVVPLVDDSGGHQMGLIYMMVAYLVIAAIIVASGRNYWFRSGGLNEPPST